jgi:hypothetical protein
VLLEMFDGANASPPVPSYDTFVDFTPSGELASVLECNPGAIQSGSCCYMPANVLDGGVPTEVSAGTVALLDNGASLVSLPFGANGYDANAATLSMAWAEGDLLQVRASGATVESFFSVGLYAPQQVSGTNVMATNNVSVSTDWTIQWSRVTTSTAKFVVELGAAGAAIKCVTDDSAGTVTVPAVLLGHFPPATQAGIAIARTLVQYASAANAVVEIAALTGLQASVQLTP